MTRWNKVVMREHYVYAHKQHMPHGEAEIKGEKFF